MTTPTLGRTVEHDERSWGYAARASVNPLARVLWPTSSPALDQGNVSSCVGNAVAQCLNHAVYDSSRPGNVALDEVVAVNLYSWATRHDGVKGVYPTADTGTSGLAGAKAAKHYGYIPGYRHAFGVDAVLAALDTGPLIVGTEWTKAMFTPDKAGFVAPTGVAVGGHEYVLRGKDLSAATPFVWARNSWGPDWGVQDPAGVAGCFKITVADLDALLHKQGDATVLANAAIW